MFLINSHTAPTLKPSVRPNGRKRPGGFDVRLHVSCRSADLYAHVYMAIASVLEQLEPRQTLWNVTIELFTPDMPALFVLKPPGREFLEMARAGLEDMTRAIVANAETTYKPRHGTGQAQPGKPYGDARNCVGKININIDASSEARLMQGFAEFVQSRIRQQKTGP